MKPYSFNLQIQEIWDENSLGTKNKATTLLTLLLMTVKSKLLKRLVLRITVDLFFLHETALTSHMGLTASIFKLP